MHWKDFVGFTTSAVTSIEIQLSYILLHSSFSRHWAPKRNLQQFTIMPNSDNEGRMTKYDPWGNQISTTKSTPLQFGHKVEMRNCTQTFGFKGPDNSRHADRALDLVEKMITRKVRPTEFELLRQPLLTSSIVQLGAPDD